MIFRDKVKRRRIVYYTHRTHRFLKYDTLMSLNVYGSLYMTKHYQYDRLFSACK